MHVCLCNHLKPESSKWAATCDFEQCGIWISVDSDQPVQPPFKLRNSKCCLVSSLTVIEYSSDLQRLWSDCAYAQADLRLCWSHIQHCWKSHVAAQMDTLTNNEYLDEMPHNAAFHQALHCLLRQNIQRDRITIIFSKFQLLTPQYTQWTSLNLLYISLWEIPLVIKGLKANLTSTIIS